MVEATPVGKDKPDRQDTDGKKKKADRKDTDKSKKEKALSFNEALIKKAAHTCSFGDVIEQKTRE